MMAATALASTPQPLAPRWSGFAEVASLLAVSEEELDEARRLLSLLGDPLRRAILEQVVQAPGRTRGLALATGAPAQDIRHRVRSLWRGGAILRTRDNFYMAAPYPAACLRKYLDLLLTATAFTHHPARR